MQNSGAFNSIRPGIMGNDEAAASTYQQMMMSKERQTMKTGMLANGDLPTIEDDDFGLDQQVVPYTMGG
jgi:hypothetical protein